MSLRERHNVSIVLSGETVQINRTAYYHQPKCKDDSEIVIELDKITDKHHRWGFLKYFNYLRASGRPEIKPLSRCPACN